MVGFIDAHRETFGVEPICAVLPIAPSPYYERKARSAIPSAGRARHGGTRLVEHDRPRVAGEPRGLRRPQSLEAAAARGQAVARCTVERLMRRLGLAGAVRGRTVHGDDDPGHGGGATAGSGDAAVHGLRPNQLWVADLTYVATWRGFVYVAFVIDVFSRRIVGWRASTSLRSDLALDALEQALYDRPIARRSG